MTNTMHCPGCGKKRAWNPFGRCSWECFDQDRDDPAEHAAMLEVAPEALAFFWGLGPGERLDGAEDRP
jgi:hypothetical protein